MVLKTLLKAKQFLRRLKNVPPMLYCTCDDPANNPQIEAAIQQTFNEVHIQSPGSTSFYLKGFLSSRPPLGALLSGSDLPLSVAEVDRFNALLQQHPGIAYGVTINETELISDTNDCPDHKSSLQQCRYLGVRGPLTYKILRKQQIACEVIGDPRMSLVKEHGYWLPKPQQVGILLIKSDEGAVQASPNITTLMAQAITEWKQHGWETIVVSDDVDQQSKSLRILQPQKSLKDIESFLEKVRYVTIFITDSLHHAILAHCAHVPTILLNSNSCGFDYLSSISLQNHGISKKNVSASTIEERFVELCRDGRAISRHICRQLLSYRARQSNTAKVIVYELKHYS